MIPISPDLDRFFIGRLIMKRTKINIDIQSFPKEVTNIIKDADIYDSSCSQEAHVYFIDKGKGYFLKEAPFGALKTEALMHDYFNSLKFTSPVVLYKNTENKDYLLTERVVGEDCLDEIYISNPEKLCDVLGETLRILHDKSVKDCPVCDKADLYINSVKKGYESGRYEYDLFEGIWDFASKDEAWKAAKEGIDIFERNTLIHGDYCLPNIMLDNWRFSGFIDLGSSGIADRHIDILWGIWTLKFNLGTDKYTDRFIDAYGRDKVDKDKLRCIAAMEMFG